MKQNKLKLENKRICEVCNKKLNKDEFDYCKECENDFNRDSDLEREQWEESKQLR